MQTRFFTFPDMETAFNLAYTEGFTYQDEHNEPKLKAYTNDYAFDVIGVIYKPTGNMIQGEDDLYYPEMAPIPGWHVNVRILADKPMPDTFEQYEVFPATPARDFA
jgi:hypothetical protein